MGESGRAPDSGGQGDSRGRILIVDDERGVRDSLASLLRAEGFDVVTADSAPRAIETLQTTTIDVVLSDVRMPEMDGVQLLREVRRIELDLPVILMSGAQSLDTALAAMELGALGYLLKPPGIDELIQRLERAARLHAVARLKREALRLAGDAHELPGDRAGLEQAFTMALETVHLAFQPIVSPATRTVFAYEALLRSDHERLNKPLDLLAAAERLDLGFRLGRRIRERAAEAAARRLPDGALLFMNIRPADLADPQLYEPSSPLSQVAARVVVELTERESLDKVPEVEARVDQLRRLGYRIAIDDLGAGYAGLTSFTHLSPDLVKLDMALVRGVDRDGRRAKLVAAMAGLCHDMRITVVAEGVETEEEHQALLRLGPDYLQGYRFGRPLRDVKPPSW
jgi:EAL domain-containing protein (putative c-di-GMP-specific phosphodiesterase class I)